MRAQKPKPRKKPVLAKRADQPFPWLAPEYPLKAWVIPGTGLQVQTVAVRQDDGSYVAVILTHPKTRFTASTKAAAEHGVIQRLLAQSPPPLATNPDLNAEDIEDLRIMRQREKNPKFITLAELRRRYRRAG